MIERIAKAMAAAVDGRDFQDPSEDDWRLAARAALQAMREPTEAMVRATVMDTDHSASHLDFGAAVVEGMPPLAPHRQRDGILAAADIYRDWQSMIDAAIAD